MDTERAKQILEDAGEFISLPPGTEGERTVCLDGDYTQEEVEAILTLMKANEGFESDG